jgi:hypothetical protein
MERLPASKRFSFSVIRTRPAIISSSRLPVAKNIFMVVPPDAGKGRPGSWPRFPVGRGRSLGQSLQNGFRLLVAHPLHREPFADRLIASHWEAFRVFFVKRENAGHPIPVHFHGAGLDHSEVPLGFW